MALAAAAVWLLAMHVLDLYWLVMPNLHTAGLAPSLLDVAALIGCVGVFLAAFGWLLQASGAGAVARSAPAGIAHLRERLTQYVGKGTPPCPSTSRPWPAWLPCSPVPPAPLFAGDIVGTVTYTGKVPTLEAASPWTPTRPAPPSTAASRCRTRRWCSAPATPWATSWCASRAPARAPPAAPATPVVIDQKGCQYYPHVARHPGRPDPQAEQLRRPAPQRARPAQGQHAVQHGDAGQPQGGGPQVRQGRGHVPGQVRRPPLDDGVRRRLHHTPTSRSSGKDGKFKISGLPPGTYEVEAWHEKLGVKTAKVTVAASASRPPPTSRSRRRASDRANDRVTLSRSRESHGHNRTSRPLIDEAAHEHAEHHARWASGASTCSRPTTRSSASSMR